MGTCPRNRGIGGRLMSSLSEWVLWVAVIQANLSFCFIVALYKQKNQDLSYIVQYLPKYGRHSAKNLKEYHFEVLIVFFW